ncbi:hypothetical protein SDC9_165952 [bioreactor metagenome]|uniref:Uncharacterized protein n=1 Tax=bioreactor metagenome TaxID=1076179 RepID=A0A645FY06_9ZZZZ
MKNINGSGDTGMIFYFIPGFLHAVRPINIINHYHCVVTAIVCTKIEIFYQRFVPVIGIDKNKILTSILFKDIF